MNYVIRRAVPADEQRIRELNAEMLRTIHHTEDTKGYEDGYLDKFFSGHEDRIYVAADDKVIAFLSAEVHRETKAYVYLDDFYVTAGCRQQGVGSALLLTAEAYAKEIGIPVVTLHAEKTNQPALQFYKNRGYSVFRDDGSRYLLFKKL